MGTSYIGAYWGSRPESALEGAERLAKCMASLAGIDDALSSWFTKGSSRASARTPVASDPSSLMALLERGRNRADVGGAVIVELGFSVNLWNRSRPEIGLSGLVGAYPSVPGILNNLVLSFPPSEQSDAASLYKQATGEAVMEAIVDAWEPEWATWTTHGIREAQAAAPREPVIGWFTYLRGVPVPETSVSVVRPLGHGVLIRSAPEFSAVDESTVLALRQQLDGQRALQPIPFP